MWTGDLNQDALLAPEWLRFVERRERFAVPALENSFFLGCEPATGLPFYLPRQTFAQGHMHVRGMTGSGKTSAALMPFVLQVLRDRQGDGDVRGTRSPVVIIDLKGDTALFHGVWRAALAAG